MKILVTGGCGYIGSHTIVDLINNGFEVISIDDNSRSSAAILNGVERITQVKVKNYTINLCHEDKVKSVFKEHSDIEGIVHFAAYKSVPESVQNPILYYQNNLNSLLNILACVKDFNIPYFVFSSSCSVYGNCEVLPVTEKSPLQKAESPYAHTKQIGEDMIRHFSKSNAHSQFVLLRYFNPVGAHASAHIGEVQAKPENLVPVITQTAIGLRPSMTVFGTDYPTRDGSCIRDYIHVMDIANAHTKALQYLLEAAHNAPKVDVFNLGTGRGVSVLEAIVAFERISGVSLNYTVGSRRPGDVVEIYANNDKAQKLLNWSPNIGIEEMMRSAWAWEQAMKTQDIKRL